VNIGRLDRRITIESKTSTLNTFNDPVDTWATLAQVWAAVSYERGIEPYQSGQMDAQRYARFKIRWRTDVDEHTCRIVHDGKTYNILGVLELGRRDGLDIPAYAHVP
jgi:SPP1 family predicted phage head-tail adaptor